MSNCGLVYLRGIEISNDFQSASARLERLLDKVKEIKLLDRLCVARIVYDNKSVASLFPTEEIVSKRTRGSANNLC